MVNISTILGDKTPIWPRCTDIPSQETQKKVTWCRSQGSNETTNGNIIVSKADLHTILRTCIFKGTQKIMNAFNVSEELTALTSWLTTSMGWAFLHFIRGQNMIGVNHWGTKCRLEKHWESLLWDWETGLHNKGQPGQTIVSTFGVPEEMVFLIPGQ